MSEQHSRVPALCVGCLSCHNAGRSLGKWVEASTAADEVDAETVTYGGQGEAAQYPNGGTFTRCRRCGGDEWDVFDWEHVPHGLRTLRAFFANAEGLRDADDLDVLLAYSDWADALGDIDDLEDLRAQHEDRYRGVWSSFREYVEAEADDIGLLSDMADTLARYFDWDAYARDMEHDYYYDGTYVWAAY